MEFHGFTLDRFQEEAFQAIDAGHSLIVAAPTGSGKTVIAEYAIERALARGEPIVYTAPIKALSNQKYRDFSERFPGKVGILTGDVSLNPDAEVCIMTTEIYRNSLFESPERVADASYVIFDEVHYLSDVERGTVWEESILFAPAQTRFLCLSATVSNLGALAGWIREAHPGTLDVIVEKKRAVPLKQILYVRDKGIVTWENLTRLAHTKEKSGPGHKHRRFQKRRIDTPLPHVVRDKHLPCLYFVFNRKRCEDLAAYYKRLDLLGPEERDELLRLFDSLIRKHDLGRSAQALRMRSLVERGIAYHHAGLLPTTKELVEQCFATGKVKLLFATETFAMGVNMPARSVVFDNLVKFDGVQIGFLPCRDFQQMSGRSGRRGKDKAGFVYATIEKRDLDPKRIHHAMHGEPEAVESQFNLSYASILSLYRRMADGIFRTVQRSFGVYQARRSRPERQAQEVRAWEDELRGKLSVLKKLGYIEDRALTKKGEFASKLSGNELVVSELYWKGHWHRMDRDALNVLAVAVMTEPRKNAWQAEPPAAATPDKWKVVRLVRDLRALEVHHQVRIPVREIYYDLAAATWAWSRECPFERLQEQTSQDLGDLVRAFRQAIQLLRQLREAAPADDPLRATVAEAIQQLNRDEVDAEKLLRG